MSRLVSAKKLMGLPPDMPGTKRGVHLRAERENWPYEIDGNRRLYLTSHLPAETQVALIQRELASAEPSAPAAETPASDAWRLFETKPASARAEAERRLVAIQSYERLVEDGAGKQRAAVTVAAALGENARTVRRWLKTIEGAARSDRLPLLAPAHCGRTVVAECSAEAWEFFKGDFLRLSRPAASACYERLQRAAKEHRWTVPSLITLRRRLERELPSGAITLARHGQDAWKRTYPAQQRDRSHFRALEATNIDGHKFDVFVKWRDGTVSRVILVAIQDLYSNKILGWRLGPTESADLVRLAIADVIGKWGIFQKMWLDNGRGFASKLITGGTPNRYRFKVKQEDPQGLLTALGVEVHWTQPYSGQSKPIERAWKDLVERIARHPACEGAYTGSNPSAKPENYGTKSVPIDEFRALVASEIAAHNAWLGRRTQACGGIKSFDQVFDESYAATPITKATAEQRRIVLLAAESIAADRQTGEIRLFGNRYWSEALSRVAGRRVLVRFDPDTLSEPVHVYGLDGRFVATAPQIERAGFDDRAAAVDHAKKRNAVRKADKEALETHRRWRAADIAARTPKMPEADVPETPMLRPFRTQGAAALRHEPIEHVSEETRAAWFKAGVADLKAKEVL